MGLEVPRELLHFLSTYVLEATRRRMIALQA